MAASKEIRDAIDAVYLDRKNVWSQPGFALATKAWDAVKSGRQQDHLNAWTFAVLAERENKAVWGTFHLLVSAWLWEETGGAFTFTKVG